MFTILECRKKANLSTQDVAIFLGIEHSLYEEIEAYRKEMSIQLAIKFSICTKISLDEIYFFNPEIQLN